ncbi:MAG: right-handed parallel beta-helix repeat-containing protein [Limnochordia bacterium]
MQTKTLYVFTLMMLLCLAFTGSFPLHAAESAPEPVTLYAAPNASGKGDGSSMENAAYFRDARFWQSVNATLQTQPVTVNLLPGQYVFSKLPKGLQTRETLRFTDFGHPEHQFVLQGLHKEGTIFTSDPEEPIDESLSIELLRFSGTNAVFRNLHFTGEQHMGYTTHFTGKNILIEDCSFTELLNTYYGSSGTAYESEYVIWRNNYFKRVGLDGHAHMLYNAYGPKHVYVIGNHFEDCSGEYVRFRDQTDYAVVYGNTFISTGTYKDGNRAFVSVPLFNDDNPANPGPNPRFEYFGTHMLVAANKFIYPDDNSPGDRRVFRFLQSGWDPPGRNLLLSPEEAYMLQTAPIEQRRSFMLKNFGIHADRIFFADNIVQGRNVTNSVWYFSYPSYSAPGRGWRDHIDITPTVITTTVVRSEEEAIAFWPAFIESLRYFATPRADDVITRPLQVQIKTPQFELKSIEIALDGEVIYSGAALPTDLTLVPAQLTAGEHLLAVTQLDTSGKEYKEEIAVRVEHMTSDDASWSRRIRGLTPVPIISHLTADEYRSVIIEMTQIVGGDRTETQQIYSGVTLPEPFELDSIKFVDGAYDLDVHYTTKYGITGTISERLVLDNWEVLEDDILAPNLSSWFGFSDKLLTADRSSGWEFVGTTPELFFNDDDRIKLPSADAEEYLTWKLANLRSFAFTIYVRDSDIRQALTLSASTDGEEWLPLTYNITVQEQNAAGWQKVLLEGNVPADQELELLKFSLKGSTLIELGYAYLMGQLL